MSESGPSSSRLAEQSTETTEPPPRPRPTTLYSWRARNADAKLLYIRDSAVANREIDRLTALPVVGFDQEWKPVHKKGVPENPVALIQLAAKDIILLVQISAMNAIPEKLGQLLENPDVVKAGVGIQYDVQKLYRDHKISTRNCVDLSLLARSVDNPRWNGKYSAPIGLARLVEEYENETLSKTKITYSNWEAVLTAPQQEYAANDAHAGFTIYTCLMAMAQAVTNLKPTSYSFDCVRGRLCEPSGAQWLLWNPNYDPGPPPPPKPPKRVDTSSATGLTPTPTPTLSGQVIYSKNANPGPPGRSQNRPYSNQYRPRLPRLGPSDALEQENSTPCMRGNDFVPSDNRGRGRGRGSGRGRIQPSAFTGPMHSSCSTIANPPVPRFWRPRPWRKVQEQPQPQ